MADPRRGEPDGMIDLATFERLDADRRRAAEAEAAQNAADDLPASLTRDRLQELKDGYRAQIEERLRNRRRQRRLLRGGEAGR
jgi:hypothetical protein